jgi:hypothetical protein
MKRSNTMPHKNAGRQKKFPATGTSAVASHLTIRMTRKKQSDPMIDVFPAADHRGMPSVLPVATAKFAGKSGHDPIRVGLATLFDAVIDEPIPDEFMALLDRIDAEMALGRDQQPQGVKTQVGKK